MKVLPPQRAPKRKIIKRRAAAEGPIAASRHSSNASTMCAGSAASVIATRNIIRRPARIPCRNRKAAIRHKTFTKPRRNEHMERKKASDFPQALLNLFDQYVHGTISRRAFLDGAQNFAVGGVTASARSRCSGRTTHGRCKCLSRTAACRGVGNRSVTTGQWQHKRVSGPAEQRDREAARCPRHPREPRSQSLRP